MVSFKLLYQIINLYDTLFVSNCLNPSQKLSKHHLMRQLPGRPWYDWLLQQAHSSSFTRWYGF